MAVRKTKPKGWISLLEFERQIGISKKTIQSAINKGSISKENVSRVGKTATAPYYLNPQKSALDWYKCVTPKNPLQKDIYRKLGEYIKTFSPDAISKENDEKDTGESLADLQKREQKAKTEIAELKAEEMKGSLVPKDEIDRQLFSAGKELRDGLLSIPNRIVDEIIAANGNRTKILNILTYALSGELERMAELITEWKK